MEYGADPKRELCIPGADPVRWPAPNVAYEFGFYDIVDYFNALPAAQKSIARRSCAVCQDQVPLSEPTFKVCGQCRKIRYCSRKCQKLHWKQAHREECLPSDA